MANIRRRNWSFLVYPGPDNKNWQSTISSLHVPYIVSPLHDKDKKDNGSLKKPHYHILLLFPGKKSYTQIKTLTDKLSSPIPQPVSSVQGLVRYFAHLDDPEKAQYSIKDIKGYCGADPSIYLTLTKPNRRKILKEISEYILTEHITSFSTLVRKALNDKNDAWFDIICDTNTWYLNMLVNSEWKLAHKDRYK